MSKVRYHMLKDDATKWAVSKAGDLLFLPQFSQWSKQCGHLAIWYVVKIVSVNVGLIIINNSQCNLGQTSIQPGQTNKAHTRNLATATHDSCRCHVPPRYVPPATVLPSPWNSSCLHLHLISSLGSSTALQIPRVHFQAAKRQNILP